MNKIIDIFFSFKTTLILLAMLALGATVATFIENDYGTSTARILVYNNIWYETVMVLTAINLIGMIRKFKMWKSPAKFLIHTSFIIILIGAAITRYAGYEGIMHIREGERVDKMISLEPYLQVTIEHNNKKYYEEFALELSALGNDFSYSVDLDDKVLEIKHNSYTFAKKGKSSMGILNVDVSIDDKIETLKLVGKRGVKSGVIKTADIDGTKISMEYGSKELGLPFSIYLKDFKLDRYPGSNSPSSYASFVTVFPENSQNYDYRIFMNQTMHEGNFLFFQSSYDQDEKGTILSVNNDPGKWPTYLGYLLLTLGFVFNLFSKKSRFRKLALSLKEKSVASFMIIPILAILLSSNAIATQSEFRGAPEISNAEITTYINEYKKESLATANNFSRLVVQSNGGLMKPIHSLDREILRKLSGKSEMFGMTADQIILGMLSRPEIWQRIKMIKVKTPKLKKLFGIDDKRTHITFSEAFRGQLYILKGHIDDAYATKPSIRDTFAKDVIKVDERLNIAYLTYSGNIFNIYPKVEANSTKWYNPMEAITSFEGRNKQAIELMTRGMISSIIELNWEKANNYITLIRTYQKNIDRELMLSKAEIDREILFNNIDIFPKLTIAYLVVGFIILIVAFIMVFNPKIKPKIYINIFIAIVGILFAIHSAGMGFRWVISGHAPWSNTYESLLYISWSAIFAGILFFRKSLLALSSAVIISAIFMFTAHLTSINPQITNLVPVLKSYWLTIHVSILTSSYGFFGLSAMIGFLTLIIFIFRSPDRPHLNETIKNIATINEMSLIIGLSAITIGNFLGGVWANESWGRYWGWDPKETWAYISIVVYAIVIHLRFVKSLNNQFVLSVASVLAFSSILMTYFGVNFYLSGLHSYATGDPVPIPAWVYVVLFMVITTIVVAYRKRDLKN
jgi:cytochrome c-type biogenesis protein CcsB